MIQTIFRKKCLITSCLSLFSFSFNGFCADLELKITTKNPQKGQLYVELYNLPLSSSDENNWQDILTISSHSFSLTAKDKSQFFMIKDLPVGSVCIRSFVDLNGNQKLDRSALGLPNEPVGFANNPPLMLGEPDPDKACFVVLDERNQQHIKLREKKSKNR